MQFYRSMNKNTPGELIEESILLEQNVAELYRIFSESGAEDTDFWLGLSREEQSHAQLIRDARDAFTLRGKFPETLLADSIDEIRQANARIRSLIEQFTRQPPGRRQALETAVRIENESGESHYTRFMEEEAGSAVQTVFQQLNRQDRDHEERIRERLEALDQRR
jgi:phosphate uptake regulator